MNKIFLHLALCFMCSQVNAFGFGGFFGGATEVAGGGTDAALLAETRVQTAKMIEELKTLKDTLDVSKRLEEMNQIKAVRQISAEGEALGGILSDIDEGQSIIERSKGNAFNQQDIQQQIDYLDYRASKADNPAAYAKMAADLKRIRFLGQANDASKKRISEGTNEADDNKTSAVNLTILADIETNKAANQAIGDVENLKALQTLTGGKGYESLYE